MRDVNETLARILDRTGDYRILRRVPSPPVDAAAVPGRATAIVLDTETTGLDPQRDAVIELGMARVAFDPSTGAHGPVTGTFSSLSDPGRPIPADVTRLTGLSDEAVEGHAIDPKAVEAFVAGASVVIAHNAGFDRPFAERAWPLFADLPWACSLTQIDWAAERAEGARLTHLLAARGLFFDGHRALDDCLALLHLLGLPLRSGETGFRTLLAASASPGTRVWAVGAPFEARALLKARRYRWADGSGGTPRAWNREVDAGDVGTEVAFLRTHVYGDPAASPLLVPVSAADRFTARAGLPAAGSRS